MKDLEQLFTVEQLAKRWGVGRTTAFERIKKFRMKKVKIGRPTQIPASEVLRVERMSLRRPSKKIA